MKYYVSLGTQTDFEKSAKYHEAGVQCDILGRHSTPDIASTEPVAYISSTEESDFDEEEAVYVEPQAQPLVTK